MRISKPRRLHLTEDLVARVERFEPDSGDEAALTPMSSADREHAARQLLAQNSGAPLWIFAYGSLIWKPAFEYAEARTMRAHGWRRAFSLDITRWRATPDQPGLMLALARGGSCVGVAYRLHEDDPFDQVLRMLEREVSYHEDLLWVRWITCRAGQENIKALVFYAEPADDLHQYALHMPVDEQAHRLARAAGHLGSGAAYLRNTVVHLEALGIRDSYLWKLQRLVADEIAAIEPLVPRK